MAIIYLYGHLGEAYGKRFDFAVHSVADAVRLLNANFSGFNAALLKHRPGFLVRVDGQPAGDIATINERHINPEIHIVPAIAGAGGNNNGWGKIVMAAVLVYAGMNGYFGDYSSLAYSMATNLALSGVSQLLFSTKQQATDDLTGETNLPNYAFSGPVNTTAQGNPVPVLYGRLRVGSQVVSAGFSTE